MPNGLFLPTPNTRNRARSVASLAEVSSIRDLRDGETVITQGYRTSGDGGGNTYRWHKFGRALLTMDGGIYIAIGNGDGYLEAIEKKILNVRQFGANGTAAYDTPAFVAAVAALTERGKLFIPSGSYQIDSDTMVPDRLEIPCHRVTIEGDGSTESYITMIGTTPKGMWYSANKRNLVVKSMSLAGNATSNAYSYRDTGVWLNYDDTANDSLDGNIRIEDLELSGFRGPVWCCVANARTSTTYPVRNITIDKVSCSGGDDRDPTQIGVTALQIGVMCLVGGATQNILINGCICDATNVKMGIGLFQNHTGVSIQRAIVSGCIVNNAGLGDSISNTGRYAFAAYGMFEDVIFSGCIANDPFDACIYAVTGKRLTITGCLLRGQQSSDDITLLKGAICSGDVKYGTVTGCTFHSNAININHGSGNDGSVLNITGNMFFDGHIQLISPYQSRSVTANGGSITGNTFVDSWIKLRDGLDPSKAVVADAGTDTFTFASHGYTTDDVLRFTATTMIPELNEKGRYYVVNPTTDTFQISRANGGTPIDLSTAGVDVLAYRVSDWRDLSISENTFTITKAVDFSCITGTVYTGFMNLLITGNTFTVDERGSQDYCIQGDPQIVGGSGRSFRHGLNIDDNKFVGTWNERCVRLYRAEAGFLFTNNSFENNWPASGKAILELSRCEGQSYSNNFYDCDNSRILLATAAVDMGLDTPTWKGHPGDRVQELSNTFNREWRWNAITSTWKLVDPSQIDNASIEATGDIASGSRTFAFGNGLGNIKTVRATGAFAIIQTASTPGYYSILVQQDGSGNRKWTYGTTTLGHAPRQNLVANSWTFIPLFYDGTLWHHVGSSNDAAVETLANAAGPTLTVDFRNTSPVKKVTITGNVLVTLWQPPVGSYKIIVTQDGTGGWTFGFSGTVLGTAPTIDTTAGATTIVKLFFDGTNWIYE